MTISRGVTMRKIMIIIGMVLLSAGFFTCSSSKATSETPADTESGFEDVQTQAEVKALQKQIKDNPGNLENYRQLASIHQRHKNNIEALKTLEQAMVIDPNDPETKYQYAEISLSSGDKLRAYQSYKEVLQTTEGENYLDRIAPLFVDAFKVSKIIGTSAQEAYGNFSTSGDKIIYQSTQNSNWDIFEYQLSNQSTRQLTASAAHEENPDYSPDGRTIIYTSTIEDHRDVDSDQQIREIFIKDLSTQKEINLTTNSSNDWHPRFSTDGKYIVFVSERNDLREIPFYQLLGSIHLMENDGRFQLALTSANANDGNPCFASGSTEQSGAIYFDSDRSGSYAIYRMDFKGKEVRQITFNPNVNDVTPAVSPHGDKIAFFSDRDGNYELYLMNADGSAQQRLTSNPADDLNPVFAPDGQKILFHSNRSGNYDLYLLDLAQQSSSLPVYEVVGKIDEAIKALQ